MAARSTLEGGGEEVEGVGHGLAVPGRTIVNAGHLLAELQGGFGAQVLAPRGHPAAAGGGLDLVPPGGLVHAEHGTFEGECSSGIGGDDLSLGRPLVGAVSVVPIEGRSHRPAADARVPFAGIALLR